MALGSVSLIAATLAAQPVALDAVTPVRTPVAPVRDGQIRATAQLISGILGYVRWPAPRSQYSLCAIGNTAFGGALPQITPPDGVRVALRRLTEPVAVDCDIIYLGQIEIADRQRVLASARGRAVLTISEADPLCRSGAMFCLTVGPTSAGFQMNIDAITRSTLRVDPRVLRLSREPGVAS